MKGILFGNKHTYDDWGLVITDKLLGLPTPKESSVDVDGADGDIDTSEVLSGEIKFGKRKLQFEFTMTTPYNEYNELVTEISNYLHGKKLKIILDEDDEYYYLGRCNINQWTSDKRIGKIVIVCNCEPYKYTLRPLITTASINGKTYVKILGKRMTVTPTIEVSNNMNVIVDGISVPLQANKQYEIFDLFIKEGLNTLVFEGNGEVKITYTGGEL